MGRERRELRISGSVSRHNDPLDGEDDILWDEFVQRVKSVMHYGFFEDIELEVECES